MFISLTQVCESRMKTELVLLFLSASNPAK